MDCMSAFCALAAVPVALLTGGMEIVLTLVLLFSSKLTDGFLTLGFFLSFFFVLFFLVPLTFHFRDDYRKERLQHLASDDMKMYGCHTIMNCSAVCPKHLEPGFDCFPLLNFLSLIFSPSQGHPRIENDHGDGNLVKSPPFFFSEEIKFPLSLNTILNHPLRLKLKKNSSAGYV